MPALKAYLATADAQVVRSALEESGVYVVTIDGTEIHLNTDDVEVRAASHEKFALAQEDGIAVALDTTLTDALRSEGISRDLVRALNDLRKEVGLEIADRIHLSLYAVGLAAEAISTHQETIAGEVLATRVSIEESIQPGTEGWHLLALEGGDISARVEVLKP
jgi:isoleucyl-tRNA synthetase